MQRRMPAGASMMARLTVVLVSALALAVPVRMFVIDLVAVTGDSMEPTIAAGSVAVVLRCAYGLRCPGNGYLVRWGQIEPGDIVVGQHIQQVGPATIKRVFESGPAFLQAAGGVLSGRGGSVGLEPADATRWAGSTYLRPDYVFLVGDNAAVSVDSRSIGPVPIEKIAGRVIWYRSR